MNSSLNLFPLNSIKVVVFVSVYVMFLSVLLLVVYIQRDPNAFYLNQHIVNSFTGQLSDTLSLGGVFTWVSTTLLTKLFGDSPGKHAAEVVHIFCLQHFFICHKTFNK